MMILLQRVAALTIGALGLAFVAACATPQSTGRAEQVRTTTEQRLDTACPVRGVWELVSTSVDGKEQSLGARQVKVVTDRHFMWLSQAARRDTLPLKTQIDTLRVFRVNGGGGTYTTNGSTYTEHIELFATPSWVGTSFRAMCRVDGDRWTHSFTLPNDTTAAPGPYRRVLQVWRRIE